MLRRSWQSLLARVARPRPRVSVVVVVHDIPGQIRRTLQSLSATYQRHITRDDYEVIIVDNGSTPPIGPEAIEGLEGHFRIIRIDPAPHSPAAALTRGLAEARGELIGLLIDGARIVTPGLLHFALHGATLYDRAVVATLGWYLGADLQRWSMQSGHDRSAEDRLLESIDWPRDGYRLFEIGTMDESSVDGWWQPIAESNAIFLHRDMWRAIGIDERFDEPGGGLLNLDLFRRAIEHPGAELVILLGEGTFHQIHGGVATNALPDTFPDLVARWFAQYEAIAQRPFKIEPRHKPPTYLGVLPPAALVHFARSMTHPLNGHAGSMFRAGDETWRFPGSGDEAPDPAVTMIVDLAHVEYRQGRAEAAAAMARLARARAPDAPAPQRLLALIGPALSIGPPPPDRRALFHLALGRTHALLAQPELALAEYRAALGFDPDLTEAHTGLSHLAMPGPAYYWWLEQFHARLRPAVVVEIGIANCESLSLVQPPSIAIAVDPEPLIASPLRVQTHIFTETSDQFFAAKRLDTLLAGRHVDFGFIDGLHLFEQVLRDVMHLEPSCDRRSVLLLHDTIPLDEVTQDRQRRTRFHTGDVWKIIPCLREARPDLDVFTIQTAWSGLTVIVNLDPSSTVLERHYARLVARFRDMPFAELVDRRAEMLNLVPNEPAAVFARLESSGIVLHAGREDAIEASLRRA